MKFVSDELGRTIQLYSVDEIGPIGGFHIEDLVAAVSERYGFVRRPDMKEAIQTGPKFGFGKLEAKGRQINIKELGFYTDGIIVDTPNTDDSSLVVDDVFEWLKNTFRFRDPETKIVRRYISHVVVDFDQPIDSALKGFETIRRVLSDAYKVAYGTAVTYDLFRIALTVDPQTLPQSAVTEFVIERRVNVPYSKNRFFSIAPLSTHAHLAFLEAIEREFCG